MNSFLNIFPMMFRARRPSRLSDMQAVDVPFWIRKGYEGMTFFGHIITHSKEDADHFNQYWDAMKNHEMIHLYQARSTHDSWICFYMKYLWQWLKACRYHRRLRNAGYLLNPFELEAYGHTYDLHYLDNKESGTTEWHRYVNMSLEERLQIYLARKRSACD